MLLSNYPDKFDPRDPCDLSGSFAQILFAEPVEICASPALVWTVMTDFERYPEWNPLNRFFKLDAQKKVGDTVTFGPCWGPYTQTAEQLPDHHFVTQERITVWQANSCLAYAAISRWLCAERVQYVCELENGNTRYHTYERTAGVLSPLMRWVYAKKIVRGFNANAKALKTRVESMHCC